MSKDQMLPVPWFRDPAFRAWIDTSLATLAAAFGVGQTPLMPTWTALSAWGVGTFLSGLSMLRHVFLAGPDLFQEPPVDKFQAAVDAAVKAALAKSAAGGV